MFYKLVVMEKKAYQHSISSKRDSLLLLILLVFVLASMAIMRRADGSAGDTGGGMMW